MKEHHYKSTINWVGNQGAGTIDYKSYSRNHEISVTNKLLIPASSDPSFRGDAARYNPEELLLASLSSCHLLWYLHLCSVNGVVVIAYTDQAMGTMQEAADGSGHFTEVTLHPAVVVANADMVTKANALHEDAHRMCFIANSCNFPVHHKPTCSAHHA